MSFAGRRSFIWASDQELDLCVICELYEKLDYSIVHDFETLRQESVHAAVVIGGVLTLHDSRTGGAPGYPCQINYRTDISSQKTFTNI